MDYTARDKGNKRAEGRQEYEMINDDDVDGSPAGDVIKLDKLVVRPERG